jgi:phosphoglucosamine mutase
MASPKYFGTDGIRGTAGKEPMTKDFAFRLGWAAGRVLGQDKPNPVILIGRDTRLSGPWLQEALQAGLESSGIQVLNLGVFPTPGVAFVTHASEAIAGVVISASHNPAAENGIKFISHDGMKLSEATEFAVEALLDSAPATPELMKELGNPDPELRAIYERDLLSDPGALALGDLRILLDCSNGANYELAPQILRQLGADPIVLNDQPDGENINAHAGSEYVRSRPGDFGRIIEEKAVEFGIAFDGDADRVILFDERGHMVDGDQILAILADYFHQTGRLLGNALVTTNMANGALSKYAEEHGFNFVETPVGDKYVTEKLMALFTAPANAAQVGIGGEQSGHIIILDEMHRTGDGLRTALWILKVLLEKPGQKLSELTGKFHKYPQLIASAYVANKPDLKTMPSVAIALKKLDHDLPGLVRMNARYSGTEPKFRLMLETDTRHNAGEIAAKAWQICDLIQKETGTTPGSKVEILNVSDGGLMQRPTLR